MIGSPCIDVCKLTGGACVGCGRTQNEIANWSSMSDKDKEKWWDDHPIYFAGIGSRKTPHELLSDLSEFSSCLQDMGYCLRSGAAKGADTAFEHNITRKDIFVAETKNTKYRPAKTRGLDQIDPVYVKQAYEIAQKHHGGWVHLSDYAKKLMARNVLQILGDDLKHPVQFVLCWTDKVYFDAEGRIKNVNGGTGLAVRLAYSLGIPVVHTHLKQFEPFHQSIRQRDFKALQSLCGNPITPPITPNTPTLKKLRWKRT